MLTTPNVARLENVARLLAGINAHDQYFGHGPYGRHNREDTREEINLMLRYAGFEIESLTSAIVYPNRAAEFANRRPLVPTFAPPGARPRPVPIRPRAGGRHLGWPSGPVRSFGAPPGSGEGRT